jgi:Rrf2 family protein
MSLLPRKNLLAIAAVIDVALNARERPVSAKDLAARHGLPTRHLEPVLQALVHDGILKGIRGPHGGYTLARERRRITVDDILQAADAVTEDGERTLPRSPLLRDVVMPAVAQAEKVFAATLSHITIEDLARRASPLKERTNEN